MPLSKARHRPRSDSKDRNALPASRVIVDERIYDKLVSQLKARVEKIQIGDPAENANMGAVIDEATRIEPVCRLHRAGQCSCLTRRIAHPRLGADDNRHASAPPRRREDENL